MLPKATSVRTLERDTWLAETIYPTQVVFNHAEPVMTRSFPTSPDLLETAILRQTRA